MNTIKFLDAQNDRLQKENVALMERVQAATTKILHLEQQRDQLQARLSHYQALEEQRSKRRSRPYKAR